MLTHPWQYAEAIRARFDGAIAGKDPDDATIDPVMEALRDRRPPS